jgi:hypothetical protein
MVNKMVEVAGVAGKEPYMFYYISVERPIYKLLQSGMTNRRGNLY